MFSGIIEEKGILAEIKAEGTNLCFIISSKIAPELKVDQSLAHNGVCLTVEAIDGDTYQVTAVSETLNITNLGQQTVGASLNLERAMSMQTRLDGHIVQGHVDATGKCISKEDKEGSWEYLFEYPEEFKALLVEKGSITVNGVSLTAFNCNENNFSVAIIPYTFHHTNFGELQAGDTVNLEFDILGKYIQRNIEVYMKGEKW